MAGPSEGTPALMLAERTEITPRKDSQDAEPLQNAEMFSVEEVADVGGEVQVLFGVDGMEGAVGIGIGEAVSEGGEGEECATTGEEEAESATGGTRILDPQWRRSKPPIKRKRIGGPVRLSPYKSRRDKALRSGKVLQNSVNEYMVATGAQVYFKSCFTYNNGGHLIYEAGQEFKLPGREEKEMPSMEEFHESMKTTVVQTLVRTLGEREMEAAAQPAPPAPSSSILSPRKNVPLTDPSVCVVCQKKQVIDGVLVFSSLWIQCSNQDCSKCAHVDCIGFFVSKKSEIEKMPKWYCPAHRMEARAFYKVKNSYLQSGRVAELPVASTSGAVIQPVTATVHQETAEQTLPSRGRSRGRGAGRRAGGRGRRARSTAR